ncbi:MAG: flagellar hook-basal body protein [Candidatus Hydrogenedentes bacterium]|nr:flagellar hook-basal body protein [Candidatus Hydrogenedentota bacterium]
MIQGLYAAATGIMAVDHWQDVIANNIANASTPGFHRQRAVQKGFYELFLNELASPALWDQQKGPGGGIQTIETYSDHAPGPVITTGDPLNVALIGPGFLAVTTPQGDRFTRNGKFTIDDSGHLTTEDGFPLQSSGGGLITIEGGALEIDGTGAVLVDGTVVGQLRLVEFAEPHLLTRQGQTLYTASDTAAQTAAEDTRVVPKSLELSNVQLPREMVDMVLALRAYAANSRVITSYDDTLGQLINQVGMPV